MMKNYFITGTTGYIGSMLVRFLLKENPRNRILAPVRNLQKAYEMFPEGVEFIQADLCDRQCVEQLLEAESTVDDMIHCASVTASVEMITRPVEATESIVNMTQNLLEYAKQCQVRSMVYLSSMEVYGSVECLDGHRVTEEEVSKGTVELLASRSCYPLGKRMAENICYSYYEEYGVPIKIARLAQTFGTGVLPSDRRVFSQFAKAVREGTDIILHTKGHSMGNYCGISDAVLGIITILENGANGEAYNVVNESNTMTIRQMAELVADKIADGKIRVVYDIAEDNQYGYAADTLLRLSNRKLRALGWEPKESLEEMYTQLVGEL